jgi:hypothetical protein
MTMGAGSRLRGIVVVAVAAAVLAGAQRRVDRDARENACRANNLGVALLEQFNFLDQVLFWYARDLERKVAEFQVYYNAARSHASLEGHTPLTFVSGHTATSADLSHVRWVSHCRDLVQLPVAA